MSHILTSIALPGNGDAFPEDMPSHTYEKYMTREIIPAIICMLIVPDDPFGAKHIGTMRADPDTSTAGSRKVPQLVDEYGGPIRGPCRHALRYFEFLPQFMSVDIAITFWPMWSRLDSRLEADDLINRMLVEYDGKVDLNYHIDQDERHLLRRTLRKEEREVHEVVGNCAHREPTQDQIDRVFNRLTNEQVKLNTCMRLENGRLRQPILDSNRGVVVRFVDTCLQPNAFVIGIEPPMPSEPIPVETSAQSKHRMSIELKTNPSAIQPHLMTSRTKLASKRKPRRSHQKASVAAEARGVSHIPDEDKDNDNMDSEEKPGPPTELTRGKSRQRKTVSYKEDEGQDDAVPKSAAKKSLSRRRHKGMVDVSAWRDESELEPEQEMSPLPKAPQRESRRALSSRRTSGGAIQGPASEVGKSAVPTNQAAVPKQKRDNRNHPSKQPGWNPYARRQERLARENAQ